MKIEFLIEAFDDAGLNQAIAALPHIARLKGGLTFITVAERTMLVQRIADAAKAAGVPVTPGVKAATLWDQPIDTNAADGLAAWCIAATTYAEICNSESAFFEGETLLYRDSDADPDGNYYYADNNPRADVGQLASALFNAFKPYPPRGAGAAPLIIQLYPVCADDPAGDTRRTWALNWLSLWRAACPTLSPIVQKFDRPKISQGYTPAEFANYGTTPAWHPEYNLALSPHRWPDIRLRYHIHTQGRPWAWPIERINEPLRLVRMHDPRGVALINPGATDFAAKVEQLAQKIHPVIQLPGHSQGGLITSKTPPPTEPPSA